MPRSVLHVRTQPPRICPTIVRVDYIYDCIGFVYYIYDRIGFAHTFLHALLTLYPVDNAVAISVCELLEHACQLHRDAKLHCNLRRGRCGPVL